MTCCPCSLVSQIPVPVATALDDDGQEPNWKNLCQACLIEFRGRREDFAAWFTAQLTEWFR